MIKMTQKNYEAIKIYNQKEKIFELKGRIQILEQQLAIAVESLKTIEKRSDKFDDSWSIQEQLDYIKAQAQSALYYIEELEK